MIIVNTAENATRIKKSNNMITPSTWTEFSKTGLVVLINQQLQIFGWSIAIDTDKSGRIRKVYPVKTDLRGFDVESQALGYHLITQYLKENIDQLVKATDLAPDKSNDVPTPEDEPATKDDIDQLFK